MTDNEIDKKTLKLLRRFEFAVAAAWICDTKERNPKRAQELFQGAAEAKAELLDHIRSMLHEVAGPCVERGDGDTAQKDIPNEN